MPDQIKIPGLGEVPKKTAIIAGAGAVGIIAIIAIRHKSSAAATSSTASATPDTTATDPNAIDPNTGIPYSQEGGADVSGYGSGYQIPYGTGGGGYDAAGSGFDAAGYPMGSEADLAWQAEQNGSATTGTTTTTTTGITTNADWVTEAESGVIPGSVSTISAAVSKVLGGLAVTSAQRDLFMEAVGVLGQPPQGYPQPIKLTDTSAQPAPAKTKTIVASGSEDLSQIAHANHTMGGVLVTLNPGLSKYYGKKTHVPKGYKIKVP
jgi:hypothetical protein